MNFPTSHETSLNLEVEIIYQYSIGLNQNMCLISYMTKLYEKCLKTVKKKKKNGYWYMSNPTAFVEKIKS